MSAEDRISLVAQFDDICRFMSTCTEINKSYLDGFIRFVHNQETFRQQWYRCELDLKNLQGLYQTTVTEKNTLEQNLIKARKSIEDEMKKRMLVEAERDALEQQINLIRDLLLNDRSAINDQTREKLAFLSNTVQHALVYESPQRLDTINESTGSILSSDRFSYDKIDEDIDDGMAKLQQPDKNCARNCVSERRVSEGKRQGETGRNNDSTGSKKSKTEEFLDGRKLPTNLANQKSPQKELGASHRAPPNSETGNGILYNEKRASQSPLKWTPVHHFTSVSRLNNRAHDFCTKTIIKPETCSPCGKKIKFGKAALKCKDCRAVCHPDCREQVPLPCVPIGNTPTTKGVMGTIADYTPLQIPMVPALIIHCIKEVESRGLSEVGLYRISGLEKEVKELKEKFLHGKGVPNLSRVSDIHSITGCLKDFLRSLKEPLILNTLWKDFVSAAEIKDQEDSIAATYQAISELPQPNRDTLAFLILHLQRVAESPECKMPISNMARIFGPTIVGYSELDPEPAKMLYETKQQVAVMERLMCIPSDYWSTFINVEYKMGLSTYTTPDAPENKKVSSGSRGSSFSVGKGYMTQTPLGPRDTGRKTRSTSRVAHFFASPMHK